MADLGNEILLGCSNCDAPCCRAYIPCATEFEDHEILYPTFTNPGGIVCIDSDNIGLCVYKLKCPNECALYEDRPAICKAFDCREYALRENREGLCEDILAIGLAKIEELGTP